MKRDFFALLQVKRLYQSSRQPDGEGITPFGVCMNYSLWIYIA
jgi:hypothetical protein